MASSACVESAAPLPPSSPETEPTTSTMTSTDCETVLDQTPNTGIDSDAFRILEPSTIDESSVVSIPTSFESSIVGSYLSSSFSSRQCLQSQTMSEKQQQKKNSTNQELPPIPVRRGSVMTGDDDLSRTTMSTQTVSRTGILKSANDSKQPPLRSTIPQAETKENRGTAFSRALSLNSAFNEPQWSDSPARQTTSEHDVYARSDTENDTNSIKSQRPACRNGTAMDSRINRSLRKGSASCWQLVDMSSCELPEKRQSALNRTLECVDSAPVAPLRRVSSAATYLSTPAVSTNGSDDSDQDFHSNHSDDDEHGSFVSAITDPTGLGNDCIGWPDSKWEALPMQEQTGIKIAALPSPLTRLAEEFVRGVHVKTHRYHLRSFEKTFIGREAVDYMVESNMALSREDAVFIGQRLMKELRLFCHVCLDHTFKDDHLFYRYTHDGPFNPSRPIQNTPTSPIALSSEPVIESAINSWAKNNENVAGISTPNLGPPIVPRRRSSDNRNGKTSILPLDESEALSRASYTTTMDLTNVAAIFSREIKVATHTFLFKRYKSTFVGSEAVDKMLALNLAETRIEAVFLGQRLLEETELFHHVYYDHNFKDLHLFYRFTATDVRPNSNADLSDSSSSELLQFIDPKRFHPAGASESFLALPPEQPQRSSTASNPSLSPKQFSGDSSEDFGPALRRVSQRRAHSSGGLEKSKDLRSVRFGQVDQRAYETILVVHPSTSSGPSIGLGWNYEELSPKTVGAQNYVPQRRTRDLILPRQVRVGMLKKGGYKDGEIRRAVRQTTKAKNQRRETMNKLTASTMVEPSMREIPVGRDGCIGESDNDHDNDRGRA